MIRLLFPSEPYWIDLPHGVRVFVRPLSTALYETVRAKASRLVADLLRDHQEIALAGGTVEGLPDLKDDDARAGVSMYMFVQALAFAGIIEWEGVLNAEGTRLAEVTEANIAELMRFNQMAETFVEVYTRSHVEATHEGNALRSSPNGTSEEGRTTAEAVPTTTCPVPETG